MLMSNVDKYLSNLDIPIVYIFVLKSNGITYENICKNEKDLIKNISDLLLSWAINLCYQLSLFWEFWISCLYHADFSSMRVVEKRLGKFAWLAKLYSTLQSVFTDMITDVCLNCKNFAEAVMLFSLEYVRGIYFKSIAFLWN